MATVLAMESLVDMALDTVRALDTVTALDSTAKWFDCASLSGWAVLSSSEKSVMLIRCTKMLINHADYAML